MIGIRGGIIPVRSGIRGGTGTNPAGGGGGIVGVTRDSGNQNYYPANAAEWTLFMAAAGLATGNPTSTWNFQESSGTSIADSIGTVALAHNMTLFNQAVPGATRTCLRGVDGTAGQKALNSTTAANPSTTSVMVLSYLDIAAAPGVMRDVVSFAVNADLRLNTNGHLRLIAGASVDLVNVGASTQQWVALQINNTGTTSKVYTVQEKFLGTYVLPTNQALIAFGGQNATNSATGFAYSAEFTGAAAELTDAQVKTLLQTLGATIPWT